MAAETKRLELLEKGRIPPSEMFKSPNFPEGIWSEWDESGLPTKDGEGKEVTKGASKKLVKEMKVQEKAHEAFLAWQRDEGK